MEIERIISVVRTHLLTVMHEEDFDLAPGNDDLLDISTDHWTIHLENGSGFLAIDEEPADSAAFATSRHAVMSEKVELALAAADRELGGTLSAALAASGDPFTLDFVATLSGRQSTAE